MVRLSLSQALHELQLPHVPPLFNFASSHATLPRANPHLCTEAPTRAASRRRSAAGMNFHPTYSAATATTQ
jgi:hypothetical protein